MYFVLNMHIPPYPIDVSYKSIGYLQMHDL